jgi:hypothetical protein
MKGTRDHGISTHRVFYVKSLVALKIYVLKHEIWLTAFTRNSTTIYLKYKILVSYAVRGFKRRRNSLCSALLVSKPKHKLHCKNFISRWKSTAARTNWRCTGQTTYKSLFIFYVIESKECVFHLRFATQSQNMTEYKRGSNKIYLIWDTRNVGCRY